MIAPHLAPRKNQSADCAFSQGGQETPSSRACKRGIAYRSKVAGPIDRHVDNQFGGKGVYWNEPDGHQWEMLTVSYARPT